MRKVYVMFFRNFTLIEDNGTLCAFKNKSLVISVFAGIVDVKTIVIKEMLNVTFQVQTINETLKK